MRILRFISEYMHLKILQTYKNLHGDFTSDNNNNNIKNSP